MLYSTVNANYGTAQLQGNECLHVGREFLACHSQVSRMFLASFMRTACEYHACHLLVTKVRVCSTTVYFDSSFSLQVTSKLAKSRRSKQTTVLR